MNYLMVELQLNDAMQNIYEINEQGSRKIASVELDNLAECVCSLYHMTEHEKVFLKGDINSTYKLHEDILRINTTMFANKEINIEIV